MKTEPAIDNSLIEKLEKLYFAHDAGIAPQSVADNNMAIVKAIAIVRKYKDEEEWCADAKTFCKEMLGNGPGEICGVDKEQLRSRLIDAYRSFPEDSEYVASKRIDLILEEIRPYLRTTEPVASDLRDAASECSHQLREAICHMTDAWRKEGFEGKSILAEMEHAISQVQNAVAAPAPEPEPEPVATGEISVVEFPSTSQFHNFAPFEAAGLEVMKQCSRYESKQVESINDVVEAALDVYRKQCEEVTQPEPVVRSEEVGSGLRAVMYRDGVQCTNQPEAMKEFIMGVVGMEYVD